MNDARTIARWSQAFAIVLVTVALALLALGAFALMRTRELPSDRETVATTPRPAFAAAGAAATSLIEIAPDPRAATIAKLNAQFGTTCFLTLRRFQDMDPDRLDQEIASVGGDNRWLVPGRSWVGLDPEDAVKAFDASWAAQTSKLAPEVWVLVRRDSAVVGMQLRAIRTPGGLTLWRAADTVAERPCKSGD